MREFILDLLARIKIFILQNIQLSYDYVDYKIMSRTKKLNLPLIYLHNRSS